LRKRKAEVDFLDVAFPGGEELFAESKSVFEVSLPRIETGNLAVDFFQVISKLLKDVCARLAHERLPTGPADQALEQERNQNADGDNDELDEEVAPVGDRTAGGSRDRGLGQNDVILVGGCHAASDYRSAQYFPHGRDNRP
jgi:hypothetical protein